MKMIPAAIVALALLAYACAAAGIEGNMRLSQHLFAFTFVAVIAGGLFGVFKQIQNDSER